MDELVLELTQKCPQRCVHCSSNSSPDASVSLDSEVAQSLVDESTSLGVDKVSFGGGEPFESSNLIDSLTEAIKAGAKAEVFTCGVISSSDGIDSIPEAALEEMADLHQLKLIFSIHGATPELHNHLSNTAGAFTRLTESLLKARRYGIRCEFNFVPMKPNACQLSEITSLAEEFNVPRVSVLRFKAQGRGATNEKSLQLTRQEERQLVEGEISELREATPVSIRTGTPFNCFVTGQEKPCRAGADKIVVQPDGNAIPCEVFKGKRERQWGLSAYSMSLRNILTSPKIKQFRDNLLNDRSRCPGHADKSPTLHHRGTERCSYYDKCG